jgi:hypothetical protein
MYNIGRGDRKGDTHGRGQKGGTGRGIHREGDMEGETQGGGTDTQGGGEGGGRGRGLHREAVSVVVSVSILFTSVSVLWSSVDVAVVVHRCAWGEGGPCVCGRSRLWGRSSSFMVVRLWAVLVRGVLGSSCVGVVACGWRCCGGGVVVGSWALIIRKVAVDVARPYGRATSTVGWCGHPSPSPSSSHVVVRGRPCCW